MVTVIGLLTIVLLSLEILSVIGYGRREFLLLDKAISFLKTRQSEVIFTRKHCDDDDLFLWLGGHLAGEISQDAIKPKRDSRGYFLLSHYPEILQKKTPPSIVYYSPTLLTSMGILGTFLGIFLGLQKVGTNIENTESLLTSANQLLSGMKTAFSTSLAGLGGASVMIIVMALGANFKQRKKANFRRKLGEISYLQPPQQLLSTIENYVITTNCKPPQPLLNAQEIASAIERVFAPYLRSIKEEIKAIKYQEEHNNKIFQSLEAKITLQFETYEKLNKELSLIVQEFRKEIITPLKEEIDKGNQLGEKFLSTVTSMEQQIENISNVVREIMEKNQKLQQEISQQFQVTLLGFRVDSEKVLHQTATEMKTAVTEGVMAMETQKQAYETTAAEFVNTFRETRQQLEETLLTQLSLQKEMLEGVKKSTEKILTSTTLVFTQQAETIKTIGMESSSLLHKTKENLLETLMNIDGILEQIYTSFREQMEQFLLEYQELLAEFLQRHKDEFFS